MHSPGPGRQEERHRWRLPAVGGKDKTKNRFGAMDRRLVIHELRPPRANVGHGAEPRAAPDPHLHWPSYRVRNQRLLNDCSAATPNREVHRRIPLAARQRPERFDENDLDAARVCMYAALESALQGWNEQPHVRYDEGVVLTCGLRSES